MNIKEELEGKKAQISMTRGNNIVISYGRISFYQFNESGAGYVSLGNGTIVDCDHLILDGEDLTGRLKFRYTESKE